MAFIQYCIASSARRMAARRLRIGDGVALNAPDGAAQGFRRTDAAFVFSPPATEVSALIEDQYNQELFFRIYNNSGSTFTAGQLLDSSTTLSAQPSSASSADIQAGSNVTITVADGTNFAIGQLCEIEDSIDGYIDYALLIGKSGNNLTFDTIPYDSQLPTVTAMPSIYAVLADADSAGVAQWVVKDAITTGSYGWAYGSARVDGLATNAFAVGAKVYLSATAGGFSTAPSLATQSAQRVGTVEVSHATVGAIRFYPWHRVIEKIGRGMLQAGVAMPASAISAGVLIGDGAGAFVEHAISGDATMSTAGALTVANNAITTAKINNSAITNAKVDPTAAIDFTKLAALTSGNILVGNGSNAAASVALSGDGLISNAGVLNTKKAALSKSGAYTVVAADNNKIIKCDTSGGSFQIDLTAATTLGSGFKVTIFKTSASNALTIDANSTETINGALTNVLNSLNSFVELICDGTNWIATKSNDWLGASTSGTAMPTTTQWGNNISLTLPAGEWDVSSVADFLPDLGIGELYSGIGIVTGNSAPVSLGDSYSGGGNCAGGVAAHNSANIPSFRVIIITATTYYLKVKGTFASGSPTYSGRISARRVG